MFIIMFKPLFKQLIADYEEQGGQTYQPHNGDGASQSSAGTASPDIFQGSGESNSPFPSSKTISVYQPSNEHDVVVTSKDIETHGLYLDKTVCFIRRNKYFACKR